ncbi:MAG: tetratricopeptide repeat protein, partial [Polyangiales bacterium]
MIVISQSTRAKSLSIGATIALLLLAACGGSGPGQAEGPKPNLDDKGASDGSGTTSASSPDLEAAMAALEAKDCKTARAKAEAVIAKTPTSADASFVLGVCDEADGKPDDAVKHYQAALATDATLTGASINLSALLIDLKQWDDAAKVCKDGLAKQKGTVELHINLSYALKGKGDHASAAKSFANAIALKPDDPTLRVDRAMELLSAGDKDGASKELKNALGKAGGNADLLAEIGVGLAQTGDAPGCVAALDKAIAAKSSPELLTERGICKHKANDLAGARKDLDDALAKDPASIKAHAAAAKYAEEAKDKKACKLHYAEVVKLVKEGELADQAKKGVD